MARRRARLLWGLLSISCLLQCTTEGGGRARRAGDDVTADAEHGRNPALTTAARLHAAAMRSGRLRMEETLETDAQRTDTRQRISLRPDGERVEERNVLTMRETDQSQLSHWTLGAEEKTQAGKTARAPGKDTFQTDQDHMTRRASQQGVTQCQCFSDHLDLRSSCWPLICLRRTNLQVKATMKQTRPCEVVFSQMVW